MTRRFVETSRRRRHFAAWSTPGAGSSPLWARDGRRSPPSRRWRGARGPRACVTGLWALGPTSRRWGGRRGLGSGGLPTGGISRYTPSVADLFRVQKSLFYVNPAARVVSAARRAPIRNPDYVTVARKTSVVATTAIVTTVVLVGALILATTNRVG